MAKAGSMRPDICEFFNKPGYRDAKSGANFIIGLNMDIFLYFFPAIPVGMHFNRYLSLSARRDLSRTGDSRTPSISLYLVNNKRRRPFVLNNEVMNDHNSFYNRLKFKYLLR